MSAQLTPPKQQEDPRATGRHRGEVAAALVIVALSLGIWVATFDVPEALTAGQIGGAAWPRLVASLLLVFGLSLLVRAVRGHRADDTGIEPVNPAQWRPLALVLVIIAAYIVAWPLVGFAPVSLVAVLLLARLLGVSTWWRAAAWAVALTGIVWLLFIRLLEVPLP